MDDKFYAWLDGTFKEDYYVKPNRITGEGRMKLRGLDKSPKNMVKRKRKAIKSAKQSRRRNRH